jgi:hypothetical protein
MNDEIHLLRLLIILHRHGEIEGEFFARIPAVRATNELMRRILKDVLPHLDNHHDVAIMLYHTIYKRL